MVKITDEMVRRKAEHNDKEIGTLEELSLHQENIEKIEHLQNWCRNLEILLLQSNLISRIENLGKLKRLKYLNLALNNIERVENLEGLESLEKLDLTLNFIGDLVSVSSLKGNIHLKQIILTGNPCTDFTAYREYTITVLPQIDQLDATDVSRSERILAMQQFDIKMKQVEKCQKEYSRKRADEKKSYENDKYLDVEENMNDMDEAEIEKFWNEPSKNTPEERVRIARHAEKIRRKESGQEKNEAPREIRLFTKDGRPLNINQPKLSFKLIDDDESGHKILDLAVYRYLDTGLISVDLQPTYVTINIKGQIFQIVFNEDIIVDKSTCQRSETTGHLVIRMPKLDFVPKKVSPSFCKPVHFENTEKNNPVGRQFLEIDPLSTKINLKFLRDKDQDSFLDDADVPPLE